MLMKLLVKKGAHFLKILIVIHLSINIDLVYDRPQMMFIK